MALPSLLHPDKLLAWGRLAWDGKVQPEPVLTDSVIVRRGLIKEQEGDSLKKVMFGGLLGVKIKIWSR